MKYAVCIDVPRLEDGIRFYRDALGFVETARPVEGMVVLRRDDAEIGLLEKAEGTQPVAGSDDVRRYARHWTPVHIDFYIEDFAAVLDDVMKAGATCERTFDGGEHPPAAFCADPFGNGFCLIGKKPNA